MKTFFYLFIIISLLAYSACNKNTVSVKNNTAWQTDTVLHHQYSCRFDTVSPNYTYLTAYDTVWVDSVKVSCWSIRFAKRPVTAGTYTIWGYVYNSQPVSIPDTVVEISGTNNYYRRLMGPYGPYRLYDYSATGYKMPKVTVTIINGKVNVQVPPLWAYKLSFPNFIPPPYKDSILISGTMIED